jgi:hypothetical protein
VCLRSCWAEAKVVLPSTFVLPTFSLPTLSTFGLPTLSTFGLPTLSTFSLPTLSTFRLPTLLLPSPAFHYATPQHHLLRTLRPLHSPSVTPVTSITPVRLTTRYTCYTYDPTQTTSVTSNTCSLLPLSLPFHVFPTRGRKGRSTTLGREWEGGQDSGKGSGCAAEHMGVASGWSTGLPRSTSTGEGVHRLKGTKTYTSPLPMTRPPSL